jgi:putative ATP-dependent endonuclease of OLD family
LGRGLDMYLNELSVEGFRCFSEQFKIIFGSGLNVIVAENGAGKTAIISAIRQLFQDSESGRYSVTDDDFYCAFKSGALPASFFSITASFDDLSIREKVSLLPWTDGSDIAQLNLHVENKEKRGRFRRALWGGDSKSSQFDPELIDLIHCIYLPPLRDAESKLTNGRQSRVSKLLRALNRKELKECKKENKLHPLEEKLKTFNQELADNDHLSIKGANKLIQSQLEGAIGHYFGQNTLIQFAESDFTRIVENLTLLFFPDMSTTDQKLFRSLHQNSLGYNNLLYIASILAELTLDEHEEEEQSLFKILLIEEPEAHLHPQLQIRLLTHIKKVAEDETNNVQVIVTTHSTVLASSVELDSIIHLSKGEAPEATPLQMCNLSPNSKNFINRWLDVTKSNLLFASGVILVEGIAEQMLIPELAKEVLKGQAEGKRSLDDQGISTINLNGIYFKHFMPLYCNFKGLEGEEDQEGLNLPVRCSGITDLDPPKTKTKSESGGVTKVVPIMPYDGNIPDGTNHALKLIDTISDSVNARLFVSKYKTLEYDLAMHGNNASLMAKILIELWPTDGRIKKGLNRISRIDWNKKISRKKAIAAHIILKRIDDKTVGKGLFAQVLADQISKQEVTLEIPEYIEKAIHWACSSSEAVEGK